MKKKSSVSMICKNSQQLRKKPKNSKNNMKTIFSLRVLLIILLFLLLHTFSENSQAQKNYNVTIETQEIEQQIYRPSTQEVSYENANVIKGENYEAVLGFEDSRADIFFSISSSGSIIDYGKLYPTNPITRDSRLSIDSLGSNGYSVFAFQDHPMTGISANNIIPNTSCDRGLCSKTTPALWNDSLTYGLGYSCEDIINSPCNNFGRIYLRNLQMKLARTHTRLYFTAIRPQMTKLK